MNTPPLAHKIIIPRPWVNSASTNVAETFARIRAEQQQTAKPANVRQMKRAK